MWSPNARGYWMSEMLGAVDDASTPDDRATSVAVVRADRVDGGVCVIACGEIDAASAPELAAELHQAIDGDDGPVLLDLGAVTFMDSSGVSALLTAHQLANGRLRLATVHPAVQRVLELTGALALFADSGHRS